MGIELWSKDMGKDMLPALARAGISREDAVFFELHDVIDDEVHVADIGKDLVSLLTNQSPEDSLEELKAHMWEFQETRFRLWEALHAKFEAMPAPVSARPLKKETASDWVQEIIDHFYSHPISTHPLMGRLRNASYPDHVGAVAFFAHQVYAFARDFLVYHLAEENGRYPEKALAFLEPKNIFASSIVGRPHIDLWGSLLSKLGISKTDGFIPEAEALDAWMLDHVRASSATSNAAMIMGIELWSKDMGKDMLPALARAGISREDAVFFE